ncbi:MAG: HD-GYP domain-containing protein [Thermotogota bacterium]
MKTNLDKIIYGISQGLKPDILKTIVALKSGDEYIQISIYDGLTNSIRDDQEGITFTLNEKMDKIIYENDFFSREINVEDYRNEFWWILSELRQKEVSLYIRPIFKPLINRQEQIGIIIFISLNNLTTKMNEMLEKEFDLIQESTFDIFEKYEKNNIIKVFINSMVHILKHDHPEIYEHSLRTADLATLIARSMDLKNDDIEKLRNAAIIHDFGLIFIGDTRFKSKSNIKELEKDLYSLHTDKLKEIFQNNPYMKDVLEIAYKHHEKANREGYYGLGEEDLSLVENILIISNKFDNLFYNEKEKKSVKEVLNDMQNMANKKDISEDVFENSKEIISSFYGGYLKLSSITSIGVSKDIHVQDPVKKQQMHKAEIISSIGNLIVINFEKDPEFYLGRNLIFISDIGGLVEKFKAKIISKTKNNYTLLIKPKQKNRNDSLKIFWNSEASIYKMPIEIDDFENMNLEKNLEGKVLIRKLGGGELSFLSEEKFINGDKKIIFFKYKGEKVYIPGILNAKIKEGEKTIYFLDYLEMNDKYSRKIYQAIFKKQIDMKMKL